MARAFLMPDSTPLTISPAVSPIFSVELLSLSQEEMNIDKANVLIVSTLFMVF